MRVTHLPMWDVTPIEIAVDVEPPRFPDASGAVYAGSSESRICLVAGFALSSQLKRIVTAVDRAIPQRLPSALRILPSRARNATAALGASAITPMLPLLRLQSRLIRAIEPGLAARAIPEASADMSKDVALFVRDFIASKTPPIFEPALPVVRFESTRLKPLGITLYRLGPQGAPQSMLGHWPYAQSTRGSNHLVGGP